MAGSEIGSATFGLVVGLGRFRKGLEEAEREAKRSGDEVGSEFTDEATDEIAKSGSRWSDALGRLKPALMAGGAMLGVAAAAGLMQGFERESEGARLAAALGLTPEQSEMAGQVAGDLYAQAYGDSLSDVHRAVEAVMGSLDFGDASGLESLSAKALDFAAIWDQDVSDAASRAGQLVQQGIARDAAHAFDLLAAAMQRVPASMRGEFLDSIEEYGNYMIQLGLDGESAIGLLVAAAQRGPYELDKFGDALKEITALGTDMSASTVEAFEVMGLNAEDMAARLLAGGDTARGAFDQIIDGLLDIDDPVKQASTALALFGTPLEDMATGDIPDFLRSLDTMDAALGDVAGTMDDAGQVANETASTEFEAFKRQVLIGLSDVALKYAIPAIRAVATLINDNLLPAVRAVTNWAKDNTPAVIGIATAIGVPLVAAFAAWAVSAATAAVATLAAMGPVLAVGAAVGALAYLVTTHWGTISDVTRRVFGTISDTIRTVFGWVTTNWPTLLAVITGPFGLAVGIVTRHWDTIKELAAGAAQFVRDRFDGLVGFITGLPGRISSAASGMWDGISDAFRTAINFIISGWNSLDFKLPSFGGLRIAGQTVIPGWEGPTLGMPDLAYLATGGTAVRPGLALVGERGPELLHMPSGASVIPLDRTMGDGYDDTSGPGQIVATFYLDGRHIGEYVTDYQVDQRARNGRGRRAV